MPSAQKTLLLITTVTIIASFGSPSLAAGSAGATKPVSPTPMITPNTSTTTTVPAPNNNTTPATTKNPIASLDATLPPPNGALPIEQTQPITKLPALPVPAPTPTTTEPPVTTTSTPVTAPTTTSPAVTESPSVENKVNVNSGNFAPTQQTTPPPSH